MKIDREVADPIVLNVINKLIDRSEKGLGKYGVDLTRGDLSTGQWVNHLQEEMLDAANYAEVLKTKIDIIGRILGSEPEPTNFEKVKRWCHLFDASKEPWLWMMLVIEEFKETLEAFGIKADVVIKSEPNFAALEMDKVALLDGVCDLIWVTYGLGHSFCWNVDEAFEEVNRSNMSKVWPDGEVHKNEDGKILKHPDTFKEPKLKKFVEEGDRIKFGDVTGFKK